MEWKVTARLNKYSGPQEIIVPSWSAQGARQAVMDMYSIPPGDVFSAEPISNSNNNQSTPSYNSGGSGEVSGCSTLIGGSVATLFIAYLFFAFFAPWILALLGVVIGFKITRSEATGLILAIAFGFGGYHAGKLMQDSYFFKESNQQAPVEKVAQPTQKAPK